MNNTGREIMKANNDCSVRAISNAMEIDYMTAYGMMLALGRRNKRGVDTDRLYDFLDSQFQAFSRPNMSVENYIKYIAHSGNWLIHISRHIFAVREGKVIGDWIPADSRSHVLKAWRVK